MVTTVREIGDHAVRESHAGMAKSISDRVIHKVFNNGYHVQGPVNTIDNTHQTKHLGLCKA